MYRVLELFSGVGGLGYGFYHSSDFRIIAANEKDPDIAKAYSLNHPDVPIVNTDIKSLTEHTLSALTEGGTVDLVLGGPPCQSFSTVGKRQMDERANLFLEYKRILGILKPHAFVFENVVGILSMDKGKLFPLVREEFERLGYSLKYKVLDAADFGVPQHRPRVILVGMRGANSFSYPCATHGDNGLSIPWVTLSDALGDLPSLRGGESSTEYVSPPSTPFQRFVRRDGINDLTEHFAFKSGERLTQIMEALKDGQGKGDLPPSLRPTSGFGNTYAKLWWNRPSTTITRNFACPSSSRCIHPRDSRALTIREGARLQSFPDSYLFYGTIEKKRLEIGNAVPPLLSIALARQMLSALQVQEKS